MPVPQNAKAIWDFLTSHGFSDNAAAGILGNIEQESGGDPGIHGGGLIQILQGNPGYTADKSLAAQLAGVMVYIKANGSVADINAHASSPSAAALYFSQRYERPLASAANNPNREASAAEVASAASSGKWPTDTSPSSGGTSTTGILGIPSEITGFFSGADTFVTKLLWIVNPSSWLRIGSFFAAVILIAFAVYVFTHQEGSLVPQTLPVPVPA